MWQCQVVPTVVKEAVYYLCFNTVLLSFKQYDLNSGLYDLGPMGAWLLINLEIKKNYIVHDRKAY